MGSVEGTESPLLSARCVIGKWCVEHSIPYLLIWIVNAIPVTHLITILSGLDHPFGQFGPDMRSGDADNSFAHCGTGTENLPISLLYFIYLIHSKMWRKISPPQDTVLVQVMGVNTLSLTVLLNTILWGQDFVHMNCNIYSGERSGFESRSTTGTEVPSIVHVHLVQSDKVACTDSRTLWSREDQRWWS